MLSATKLSPAKESPMQRNLVILQDHFQAVARSGGKGYDPFAPRLGTAGAQHLGASDPGGFAVLREFAPPEMEQFEEATRALGLFAAVRQVIDIALPTALEF